MDERISTASEKLFFSPQHLPGFLDAWKSQRSLWQTKHPGGAFERRKAWAALVEYCKPSIPSATENWLRCRVNSIRASFNKERRKVRSNPQHKPKLWYYKHMLRLLKQDDSESDPQPSSKSRKFGQRDSKDSEINHQNENDSDAREEDPSDEDHNILSPKLEFRIESTFSTQNRKIGNFPQIARKANLPVGESDYEDFQEIDVTAKSADLAQKRHTVSERDRQDQEERCKLIEKATKELYKKGDVYEAYGQIIESKLRNLANLDFNQYLHAERLINDAIYRAFQRQLTPNTTIIECQPQFVSQPSGTNVFPPQQNVCPNPASSCPPYSQPGPLQNRDSNSSNAAIPGNPGETQSVETVQR